MIDRPRLLTLCAHAEVVLLVAAGGYGKSTLARALVPRGAGTLVVRLDPDDRTPARLAARLAEAADAAGLPAVTAALAAATPPGELDAALAALTRTLPEGTATTLDDVHRLGDDGRAGLLRTVAVLRRSGRVVVCGRDRPDAEPLAEALAAGTTSGGGLVCLDERDLAFDDDELTRLAASAATPATAPVVTPAGVRALARDTGRWPAAAALTLAAGPIPHSASGIGPLVERLLTAAGGLGTRERTLVAGLPGLDPPLCAALGVPDLPERIRASGLPLHRGPELRVIDPVREHLAGYGPLAPADAVTAARWSASRGRLGRALDLLADAGRADAVAALVAGLPTGLPDTADLFEISSAVRTFATDADPAVLARAELEIARAAGVRALAEVRTQALQRAAAALDRCRDDVATHPLARELAAEGLLDEVRQAHDDDAVVALVARAQALLEACADDEAAARQRCLHLLARAAGWRNRPELAPVVTRWAGEAAGLARMLGRRDWQADALLVQGYLAQTRTGHHELAVATLTRAVDLLPGGSRNRARILTFLGERLTEAGRYAEADVAVGEALAVGHALADDVVLAYAHWEAMRLAVRTGRDADAAAAGERARVHLAPWWPSPVAVELLGDLVDAACAAGDAARAARHLEEARAAAEEAGCPDLVLGAAGTVEAVAGDPDEAVRLLGAWLEVGGNATDRLRPLAYLAHAHARAGRRDDALAAAAALEAALREAGSVAGPADLARAVWPGILALRAGSTPQPAPGLAVQVLGGFAVRVDGHPATGLAGHPARLVKLLAVEGRPVTVQQAAEALWPGDDEAVARRRLRNVLTRVRAFGPLLDRPSDGLVGLHPAVLVDAAAFESRARTALRAGDDARGGLAEDALAAYGGELLPDDRLDEQFALARENLALLASRLRAVLLRDAAERGDVDRAVALVEALVADDPYDDASMSHAADLLRAAGRRPEADWWAARARRTRADLQL